MEDYTYSPLSKSREDPEIRLLELHPAEANEPIVCSIRHVRMLSKPSYRAISYCWGKLPPSRTIMCNGKRLVITESLHGALQRLQEPPGGSIRHVWADAICLNQHDTAEKSFYVGFMFEIYSAAQCVDAWLGPAFPGCDELMSRLQDLGGKVRAAGMKEILSQWSSNPNPRSWYDGSDNPPIEPHLVRMRDEMNALSDELAGRDIYANIEHLADLDYWNRVWVLQEVVVAKQLRFLCGSATLPFDDLAASTFFSSWHSIRRDLVQSETAGRAEFTSESRDLKALTTMIAAKRRRSGELGKPPDTLFELLIRTRIGIDIPCDKRASNKRDLVYGLLSMAIDRVGLGIEIDYDKSVQEVYTDTARALLHRGHMTILTWNQFPKDLQDLPSWAPDLSMLLVEPHVEHRWGAIHRAAGDTTHSWLPTTFPPVVSPSQGMASFELTCYSIDVIDMVGNPFQPENLEEYDFATINTYLDEIDDFVSKRPPYSCSLAPSTFLRQTPERWAEAHWRIPTADQLYSGVRKRAEQALYDTYVEIRKVTASGKPKPPELENELAYDTENLSLEATLYCENLNFQLGRKPMLSKNGYVGLAPKHARAGDHLFIVHGASVPYVFRRLPEGKDGWELIGEAYIDGLMDGEVLEDGTVKAECVRVY